MSYATLPPEVRQAAERVLTPAQLEAFEYHVAGWGMMRIARRLGITKGSVQARLENAELKLRKEGVKMDEFGRWHLERAA